MLSHRMFTAPSAVQLVSERVLSYFSRPWVLIAERFDDAAYFFRPYNLSERRDLGWTPSHPPPARVITPPQSSRLSLVLSLSLSDLALSPLDAPGSIQARSPFWSCSPPRCSRPSLCSKLRAVWCAALSVRPAVSLLYAWRIEGRPLTPLW